MTEKMRGLYEAFVCGERIPPLFDPLQIAHDAYRLFFDAKGFDVLNRVKGCLYGCAVGDALGYPVEFMNIKGGSHVVEGFSKSPAYTDAGGRALYTDDTQMTLRTVSGLLNASTFDDIHVAGMCVGDEYVTWMNEDPPRAPGNTCMFGCRQLETIGVEHWSACGKPDGGGCGTVMRSSPYGLWHNTDPMKAALWAGEHSYMTHGHTMASSGAAAMAAGIAYLFHSSDRRGLTKTMVKAAKMFDDNTASMLCDASMHALYLDDPEKVLGRFLGWRGDEAIAASLYCLLMGWNSFDDAVLLAVNSPGDSDSLGAITGALAGTLHGFDAIDPTWTGNIENSDAIDALSEELSDRIW